MDSVMLNVGLDYHPGSVQVCVLDAAGNVLVNRSCADDWRQIAGLTRPHGRTAARCAAPPSRPAAAPPAWPRS